MFAQTYAKYYDLMNQDKHYKKEIEFVYKWADKPLSILDIGCGTASYWKYYPTSTYIKGFERSMPMGKMSTALPRKELITIGDVTTSKFSFLPFDCSTALFDVINYIPKHDWWKNLPLKKGGYFIFDIWDKEKVDKMGFRMTIKAKGGITRIINPLRYDGKSVKLNVTLSNSDFEETELHTMYVYSEKDIKKFCGKQFEIVDKKETKTWQTWLKLKRK